MKTLLSITLILFTTSIFAENLSENEIEVYTPHYAFSNYFGTGLYSSTGQEITVFNIPFEYEPEQDNKNRYRIRLPVSLGFYNFDLDNIEEIDNLTDDAATLTLTVGIEFDHWINHQLKLVPFLDIGVTENFSNNETAAIYASGMSSYYYFNTWEEDHTWLLRFQRAGFRTDNTAVSDGFSSIETGLDLKLPFRFNFLNHSTFITTYIAAYWFTVDLAYNPESSSPRQETNAQELGFTLGTESPLDFGFFNIERIGLGYRYSKSSPNIWRLTFNMPLD